MARYLHFAMPYNVNGYDNKACKPEDGRSYTWPTCYTFQDVTCPACRATATRQQEKKEHEEMFGEDGNVRKHLPADG